jgi:ketosteroid isomerase-like protein
MRWITGSLLLMLLLFSVFVLSCTKNKHTNDEIEQAMNNYDSLILKQDAAAIAQVFTPDGKLGDAATGRDAIQKLLSQITGFKVIEQSSTTTGIQIRGDSALQQGTYIQRGVDARNDTVKAMGTFTCKWKWMEGEGWKIARIVTVKF